jgi:hypothetical protein
MQNAFSRYFRISIGVIGAVLCGGLVLSGLRSGSIAGFGQASLVLGAAYREAFQPSQFWFILFFWLVGCACFIWLAWSAYRD